MESAILSLYKKLNDKTIIEYVLKNLEYFLGKILIISSNNYFQNIDNYNKLE
jgi:hypothetical protein